MKIFNYLLATLFALNLAQIKAQCAASGSHYTASYPTGWTVTDLGDGTGDLSYACSDNHNGTFNLSGTAASFYTARGSRELRASRPIPVLSNTSWTMDFKLTINPSSYNSSLLPTNSPSVVLAALTADQMSLQTSCVTLEGDDFCASCGTYPNTNMDAIWVYLTSDFPNGCSQPQSDKNWRIVAAARDGNGTQNNSTEISIPSGVTGIYYIRLQRTSAGQAVVSVFSNSNFTGHLAGSPQCLSIPGHVTALDVLSHEVHSQGVCWRTFNGIVDNLKIDNSVTCPLPLTPSFTMAPSACLGPFTVDGSASTSGTIPISAHWWKVVECSVNGTQIGTVWSGPHIDDAPLGSYTITPAMVATGGVTMQCGHYYKVSLVVSNCGNAGTTFSKVIYISCPLRIKLKGSTSMICRNDPAALTAVLTAAITGGSGNYTMTWQPISPAGGIIYSGPPSSFFVTPNVTTTYQVTVYDNVTGCSSTVPWTVTVTGLDPTFNLSTVANPSYFTVSLTPNNLAGYSLPVPEYGLIIEELDASNNPMYAVTSMGNTTCWWNYPTPETFLGFVSTGTGLYTQNPGPPCGSTPGQFLYNHTYRLTQLALSDLCPEQFSMIVTTVKSGQVIFEPDPNAPGMTHMLAQGQPQPATDNIHIFPNPSTGIFTIELEEEADVSLIEVTNALGQKVKSFEAKGTRPELDLTGFTKGIYIVRISSNGNTTTKKIILE